MKKHFVLPFIFAGLVACNSSQQTSENKSNDTTKVSTSEIAAPKPTLPWTLVLQDSLIKEKNELPSAFIRSNVLPLLGEQGYWELNEFLKIDSMRKAGAYENYVENLDIGQTKEAAAWVYDTLEFENQKAILWGVTYGSFEACPYFGGKSLFLTAFVADKPQNTVKVLEISSSSDAPVYMSTKGECVLESTGSIACIDSIETGGETGMQDGREYEETIINTVARKYKLDESGKITEVSTKKSPEKRLLKLIPVSESGE